MLPCAYAPTMLATDDEKLAFYLSLKEVVRAMTHKDKIIILGDFNARFRKDLDTLERAR